MTIGRSGRMVAVIMVLAAAANSASADIYGNIRYGYSVTYSSALLVPEPEADNGDGRHFHARRGPARMSIWADGSASVFSPGEIEHLYEKDCSGAKPAYRVVKPDLIALSCRTPKDHILYVKAIIRGEWVTTLTFDYPYSERSVWDSVVKQVAASMVATSDATLPG